MEQFLATAAGEKLPLRDDGSVVRLPATLLSTVLPRWPPGRLGGHCDTSTMVIQAHRSTWRPSCRWPGGGPSVELAGSVKVEREGVWVVLGWTDPQPPLPPARSGGSRHPPDRPLGSRGVGGADSARLLPISFFAEVFDADLLPGTLTVRSMESADCVAIVGGSKGIADVLAEAQIPVNRRAGWPLVLSGSEVLWVPGVRRGNQGWVSGATSRYLWVRATVEGHL